MFSRKANQVAGNNDFARKILQKRLLKLMEILPGKINYGHETMFCYWKLMKT